MPFTGRFGDYELLGEIARGGMGVVYQARQVSLNRIVAVKMLLAGELASREAILRFRAEAEAAAKLRHPNIVAIYETGEIDGQHYFSMDYVQGQNLALIVHGHPLPLAQAVACVRKIAGAVQYAHEHHILHRDLKPSNVLIDEHNEPRVTDFGLAKQLTVGENLTVTGQLMGSPGFMAPEQADPGRAKLGPQVDVYAIGGILYYLLTSRPPFQANNITDAVLHLMTQDPVSPRLLNPSVPRDLETICLKCLEKDVSRRYLSAGALADELERFARDEPILARPIGPAQRAWRWCKRQPVRAGLIAALVAVFALGLGGVLWQADRANAQRALAQQAERAGRDRLWASYLAQARASRWSARPGRRFDSLLALHDAALIRPTLEVRNEAIACFALSDARLERNVVLPPDSQVQALSFTRQFDRYAWVDEAGVVRICQARDDRELLRLASPVRPLRSLLLFSPDAQFLALAVSFSDGDGLILWNLNSRQMVLTNSSTVRSWTYSPDQRHLVVAEASGRVHFYDLVSGDEVKTLTTPPRLNHLRFRPTGRWLAVTRAASPTLSLLDLDSGAIGPQVDAAEIRCPSWSPDGRTLAGPGDDGQIYFWDGETGNRLCALPGHTAPATAVEFNHEGDLLVSCGWDGMVRFWEPPVQRLALSVPGGFLPPGFSADDRRLAIGTGERDFAIWQVEPARECRRLGPSGLIYGAAFAPGGEILVAAASDGLCFWSARSGRWKGRLPLNEARSVVFTHDSRSFVASGHFGIQRWPLHIDPTGSEWVIGSPRPISSELFERSCPSPDGKQLIATGGQPDAVTLFELGGLVPPRPLNSHPFAVDVAVSPCGKWFATGTWHGSKVNVWSTDSWGLVRELPVRGSARCAFTPDGQWLVSGSPTEYSFWSVGTWEAGLRLPRDRAGDYNGAMAFSPDGRIAALLIGRNSGLRLVALPQGHELATLDTGEPLCFSPDGTQLATSGEDRRSIFIWDLGLIRRHLAAMNLDFELPSLPPASARREVSLKFAGP